MTEVVLGTLKIKVKENPWRFMLVNFIQQAMHFWGRKKSHQTLTDSQRKECGDAKPQLSCWDTSIGKRRGCNLALWKSWDGEGSAHSTWGMGLEKGETAAFTVHFSLMPHTLSSSHRNLPRHIKSVTFSKWPGHHLPWHLFHRAGPARTLLLAHDQKPTWDSKR